MSTLSPQAQAVLDAFRAELEAQIEQAICGEDRLVAAAFRAAADQPYQVPDYIRGDDYGGYVAGVEAERDRYRAIAAELDPGDGVEVGG